MATPAHHDGSALDRRVEAVRSFNRFYTKRLGVLAERFLRSPFTLAEGRVLYELAHREAPSATEIGTELGLDRGYLSRILQRFEAQGFLERSPSIADARRAELALTPAGREAFAPLDERSHEDIAALLTPLSEREQARVLDAMDEIADALGQPPSDEIVLRAPEPGDFGWIVERHGAVYEAEYGWDLRFEAEVTEMMAKALARWDPARERAWIAERNGIRCGCVMSVRESDDVARLRLLLVEPGARGSGLGRRLVRACIDFARAAGYTKMVLWTHSLLTAARAIYASEGFTKVGTDTRHASWGPEVTSETWERPL
jgi:DNA-binding MarR family transcriptional regulator/N-acetylglutamate synthase-like GNAT family acetyltransferase